MNKFMGGATQEDAIRAGVAAGLSFAAIAREVDEPYNRVYGWLQRAGLVAERNRQLLVRREEADAAEAVDRERFAELLAEYRSGLLVPKVNYADASRVVLDVLIVQPAVERLTEGDFDSDLLGELEHLRALRDEGEL